MTWTYEDFKKAVERLTAMDLSSYKERQMKRRIDFLISRNGYFDYENYFNALKKEKPLLDEFLNYLTINVSEFYRNPGQWEILSREIVPSIMQKHRKMKIWSAACSTGEEPYSLVMALSEMLPLRSIKVLATDIDKEALEKAKKGRYAEKSLEGLPDHLKDKYFFPEEGVFTLDDKIKSCVEFQKHDLLKDPFPEECHLILCRNVMIYFTEEAKANLYPKFYQALHPDGVLFVGSTEQIILPYRYGLQPLQTFFYRRII